MSIWFFPDYSEQSSIGSDEWQRYWARHCIECELETPLGGCVWRRASHHTPTPLHPPSLPRHPWINRRFQDIAKTERGIGRCFPDNVQPRCRESPNAEKFCFHVIWRFYVVSSDFDGSWYLPGSFKIAWRISNSTLSTYNRLIHDMDRLVGNGIHRLTNGINRLIHGITRLIHGIV